MTLAKINKGKRSFYSVNDERRIRHMHEAGKGVDEIALATNRTTSAIRNKMAKMGLQDPNRTVAWTREATVELLRLAKTGLPYSQIAEQMGRPKNSIAGKLHRMGFEREPPEQPAVAVKAEPAPPVRGRNTGGKKDFGAGKWTETMAKYVPTEPRALSRKGTCQHIADEPTHTDECKCGARTLEGSAYCEEHHDLCYIIRSAWGQGTAHNVKFIERRSGSDSKADPPGVGTTEYSVDATDDSRGSIESGSGA